MLTRSSTALVICISAALGSCALPGPELDFDDRISPASIDYTLHAIGSEPLEVLRPDASAVVNDSLEESLANYEYRVGPRDVLSFTVWGHDELTIPSGDPSGSAIQGHLVGADGTIFFPHVGVVPVAGLTIAEIRTRLSRELGRFLQSPQLDARVVDFRSQRIMVTGEVARPGVVALTDVPRTLVEALDAAGGRTPRASLSKVQVTRAGKVTQYDLESLFARGDLSQNILLEHGDVIYVPDDEAESVHVIGEIDRPGLVPMRHGRLNLAEALSSAGSFSLDTADVERVFVIRRGSDQAAVHWLDAKSPAAMLLATQFELQPQDVVFVAARDLARWNRLVLQIIPTLQTILRTPNVVQY